MLYLHLALKHPALTISKLIYLHFRKHLSQKHHLGLLINPKWFLRYTMGKNLRQTLPYSWTLIMIISPTLQTTLNFILMDQRLIRLLQPSLVAHITKERLPNDASIFSAEIRAIDLALNFIEHKHIWNSIIFCDSYSFSVLQTLHNIKLDNPLLVNFLVKNSELSTSYNIVYCWLPSHNWY